MYISSNLRGSSLTLNTGPRGSARVLKGAVIREGVCCHLGRPANSTSCSGACMGAEVENLHAEVSVKGLRRGCDARATVDGAETSDRAALFDAIVNREWRID
jgi:hypothetical protein